MPYEYGRVKDGRVFSDQATARNYTSGLLPDYLYLGRVFPNNNELIDWMRQQLRSWARNRSIS